MCSVGLQLHESLQSAMRMQVRSRASPSARPISMMENYYEQSVDGGFKEMVFNRRNPHDFTIQLDVRCYALDEIHIDLKMDKLYVVARHVTNSQYGYETYQIHRCFPLPRGIRKSDIVSRVTKEGMLIIRNLNLNPSPQSTLLSQRSKSYSDIFDIPDNSSMGKASRKNSVISGSSGYASSVSSDESTRPSDRQFMYVGEGWYEVVIGCNHLDASTLKVTVDRSRVVKMKAQELNEDGQDYLERIVLPRDADPKTVESSLKGKILYIRVKSL